MRTPLRLPAVFLYNWYSAKKKTMWFTGVEVEQKTSAPPPKKNPASAPGMYDDKLLFVLWPCWGVGRGGGALIERKSLPQYHENTCMYSCL